MSDKVAVVIGVGPGLGSSVAERFAREGYTIVLMSRSMDKLTPVQKQIEAEGGGAVCVTCDATKPESVVSAFAEVRREVGHPEVLVYNAGAFHYGGILDLSAEFFEACWKANCFGAFLASQEVLQPMIEAGRGTILFTGATASRRGSARFSALAVGKFGLRALAQSMAREFGPAGIHVAHVVIDGQIALERTMKANPDRGIETFLDPDGIAETYWQLHTQDPTVWTLELDLRPSVEEF